MGKVKLISKKVCTIAMSFMFMFLNTLQTYATSIQSSKLYTGTEKLIQDLTTMLIALAPIVGGALIVYFFIRRGAADEMEQKQWNSRIVTVIISCAAAVLGAVTLNLIMTYYS